MTSTLSTATYIAALTALCMVIVCMIVFIVDTIITMKKRIGKRNSDQSVSVGYAIAKKNKEFQ
jgi:hypothetical protein